jgi:hypothetical protein
MVNRGAFFFGVNLLSLLMERNLKECFKLVVDRGGRFINGMDRKGHTPVHYFLEAGQDDPEMVAFAIGEFHDQGDAKGIVIRKSLWGHNDTACGWPAPGRPIGGPGAGRPQAVIGVFSYY